MGLKIFIMCKTKFYKLCVIRGVSEMIVKNFVIRDPIVIQWYIPLKATTFLYTFFATDAKSFEFCPPSPHKITIRLWLLYKNRSGLKNFIETKNALVELSLKTKLAANCHLITVHLSQIVSIKENFFLLHAKFCLHNVDTYF